MRKILFLSWILLCSVMAFAQTRTITGKVIDPAGEPIPGASVTIKGTTSGVSADATGMFSISAKTGDVLVISSTNYRAFEQKVGSENNYRLVLGRSIALIDEVVVTAQGIRRRAKELGYSLAKISNEDITVGRSPQLAQSLSGKVSGLAIYNVDNSVDPQVKVVLRGYRSLTGSNDALIVIDGIPNTSQSVLSLINPNDIESVTVLKGGQAATLFGSQGVNGALVITTKKGSKGKLKVTYSSGLNYDQISFLPDFQTEFGNGSHYATSFGAAGYKTDYLERMKDNWRPFENQQYGDRYDNTNRIVGRVTEDGDKLIIPYANIPGERRRTFDKGYTINNQVGFSGGDETSSYYMSIENNKTAGIVPGDESKRTGVRLAATKTSDKIRVGFNAAYVQNAVNRTTSDFYFDVLNVAPHIPISSLKDWRTNKFANPNGFYDDYYNNPYFNKDNNRQNYQDANITGNLDVNYQALPWLNFYNRIGVIQNTRNRKNYTGQFLYSDWAKNSAFVPAPWDYANDYDGIDRAGTDIQGSVFDQISSENVINNDIQAQISKNVSNFSNKLILGFNVYQRKTKQTNVGSGSIVVPEIYNVSNRRGELAGGEANSTERKYGYYADLTTGWKDLIFVHGSFRYDATSKFFKPTRATNLYSYPYYGVDVSAILTDAFPAIKGSVLGYAKLRAGFNRNGNDNLGDGVIYGLDLSYPNGRGFPYGNTVGLTVGDLTPDAGLKPEFVTSYEAGGEFQFFKGRVSLEGTYYTQTSKGQVIDVKIPVSTGFPQLRINVGETKNWGYETDLRVQVLKKMKYGWEVSARYSYNDNKVVNLYPGVNEFQYGGYSYANTNVITGMSFPQLKALPYTRDPEGRVVINKTTGYPIRKSILQNFGRTIPKHILGWGTRFNYSNFTLAANFEYRGGNVTYHQLGRDMTFTGSGAWTSDRNPHVFPNSAYDDGTGKFVPNTTINVREAEYALWVDQYRLITENFVTPGWFIKFRDVNLSYNVPADFLRKSKFITNATIAVYGRNLFTIVDKSNFYTDPEFSFTTGNGVGINNTGQTPPVRQYGVNLNLSF